MKKTAFLAFALVVLVSGMATAQLRTPEEANTRIGPENFSPLGGDHCSTPGLAFGLAPSTVSDTISVAGDTASITSVDVGVQITHTWVGDIVAQLSHDDTATSALIIDQPGVPNMSACGCSSDDIDVTLSDSGSGSVEDACDLSVPAISGTLTPSPDALSVFNGEDSAGDWTLTITDALGSFDDGVFNEWCLTFNASGGTTGGTGTPATTTWGVALLIALFMGASLFFLRKRAGQNV